MNRKIRKYLSMVLLLFLLAAAMPQQAEAAVKLNKTAVSINVKKTVTLKVSGTNGKVTWKSSNNKIATVSSLGVVKGINKGTATITAAVSKSTLRCKVTVKQPVTGLKLNKTSAVLKKGSSFTLKAAVSPANATNKSVVWKTSNNKVATVSSKGVVKGIGKGTAIITVIARDGSNKKATCKVTVKQLVHTHKWVNVTKNVHHAEKSHTEKKQVGTKTVVDKEAWDELVKHWYAECTSCGLRDTPANLEMHIALVHYDPENDQYDRNASWRSKYEYETIHHDAETHEEPVYEDVWVEDVAAWDETIHTGIFHYVVDGEYLHDTLATIGDATYYFDSEGYTVSGWLKLDEGWSYFDDDCKRQTGWQDKDGSQRYIDPETGIMVTSQIRDVDSGSYYFNSEGEAFTPGIVTDAGKDYYFTGQDFAKDTWMDLDTGRYYFGDDGAKATGVIELDGEVYPLGDDGAVKYMQWVDVGNTRYYTNDCGSAMEGWRVIDGRKYYFADERYDSYSLENKGRMLTGFKTISGRKYYFLDSKASSYNEDDKGELVTGWKTINGRRYYFLDSHDASYREWKEGVMQTGFHKINGKRYYLLDKKSSAYKGWKEGAMQTGIVPISGKKYFFSGSGVMQGSRIVYVKGNRYFFAGNGVMQKNRWVNFNHHRYYLAGNGKVKTGWYRYKGRWFYFDKYGRMRKGLTYVGGRKYFFGTNGVLNMRKSVWINGRWYWADGQGILR